MLTSPFVIKIRAVTRKLGLNRVVGKMLAGRVYEDKFGAAICSQIRPGDTVWDIGANLGHYTNEFLQRTGPTGKVVAFEPVAACFNKLRERFAETPNAALKNMAVGDSDGSIAMSLSDDPLAATHQIVIPQTSSMTNVTQVEVRAATSIIESTPELFPNVVKIDVEGHEGSVMDGMHGLLADRRLRCIGVEVHFGLLDARGESGRPKQMEAMLRASGFRVQWTDTSHLLALR